MMVFWWYWTVVLLFGVLWHVAQAGSVVWPWKVMSGVVLVSIDHYNVTHSYTIYIYSSTCTHLHVLIYMYSSTYMCNHANRSLLCCVTVLKMNVSQHIAHYTCCVRRPVEYRCCILTGIRSLVQPLRSLCCNPSPSQTDPYSLPD